ncbi:hypothetical protein CBR_g19065 [Chara braunii]|uniref:Uncharacterized protein n=1 Tax=Chara braunii TaxID=69332 RepID=A0A388KX91_CHABU|nr:hypothetical protein CBR_g19065 [Chara braunii]|eukprot:GBG74657.1 hypothetical protein CBR_g19065 [Chara braunii]
MEETQSWRNEALRPGNKRGTISLSTPECDDRLRSRQRVIMSPNVELREEIRKMKDSEYCTMREMEVIKQRKADEAKGIEAERKKLEAEAEVTKLREQVEKLSMEVVVVPTGGTNMKGRLEAVAASGQKTVRRGRPRLTPAKTPRKDDGMKDANDRFIFLREENKRLRVLKKSGLEAICQQEGIEYKTVDATTDELAEIRVNARRFDMNIRSHLVIRITYDECLNKAGIHKLCAAMIGKLDIVEGWKWMMVQRMRLVWKNNMRIGDILYNFRRVAREGDVGCGCGEADRMFTRKDGHVCFKMGEVGFVPTWMRNAKNVPKPSRRCTIGTLKKQIMSTFEPLLMTTSVSCGEIGLLLSGQLMKDCFNRAAVNNEVVCTTDEVYLWRERFEGLVRCPIDHNPGDSLVCCPGIYQLGMKKMFLENVGFEVCSEGEDEINLRNGKKYREMGLESVARWNLKGRMGRCYVIPTHRRPICPTYEECGVVASKRVSRAVNRLLWDLPLRNNFNMRSTKELVKRITEANKELKSDGGFVGAAFDIKEMFCYLPHDAIVRAMEWILDYWIAQGAKGILLKGKGKEAKIRMGDGQDGWKGGWF